MFSCMTAATANDLMRLSLKTSVILAEAQAVMTMRIFGMMGMWPVRADENSRMMTEKIEVLHQAQAAALRAAMKGGSAAAIAEAALRPVGRCTKANAGRLARGKA